MLKELYRVNVIKRRVIYNRLKRFQEGAENEWKMKLMEVDILPYRPMKTFYMFEHSCYPIDESLSG
jgi:hypothetical protein